MTYKSNRPNRSKYIQGPFRAVDLLDLLAWADVKARDNSMAWGTPCTDAYYKAWQWLTAVVLENPRPELPINARLAMQRVQQVRDHRLQSDR